MTSSTATELSKELCAQAADAWRKGDRTTAFDKLITAAESDSTLVELVELAAEIGSALIVPMVKAGHRLVLLDWYTRAQMNEPNDVGLARTVGLLWYWLAHEREGSGQTDLALEAWRIVIANWGMVLGDVQFLKVWTAARAKVYGIDAAPELAGLTAKDLAASLVKEWHDFAERHIQNDQMQWARQYRELALLFQIEREATRLLQRAGGLRIGSENGSPR